MAQLNETLKALNLQKIIDTITSDDYCAREMDIVGSDIGVALNKTIEILEGLQNDTAFEGQIS